MNEFEKTEVLDALANAVFKRLEDCNPEYKDLSARLDSIIAEICIFFEDGGKELPPSYNDKLRYYFENVANKEVFEVRTVYICAFIDCITTLMKLGYTKNI